MQRPEYESICLGVKQGGEHFVEDMTTHHVGKVVSCQGTHFEVELEDKRQSWPSVTCREKWEKS